MERQQPRNWSIPGGTAFAIGHVIFILLVLSQHFEGSWGGFLIFLVDFPVSFVLLMAIPISYNAMMAVMLVLGTIWWFFVGRLLTILIQFIVLGTVPAIQEFARWLAVGSEKHNRS